MNAMSNGAIIGLGLALIFGGLPIVVLGALMCRKQKSMEHARKKRFG